LLGEVSVAVASGSTVATGSTDFVEEFETNHLSEGHFTASKINEN